MLLLPVTEEGQEKLAEAVQRHPIHRDEHPTSSGTVERRLQEIDSGINRDFAIDYGPARDFAIWLAIDARQVQLRQEALSLFRIVEDDRQLPYKSG